MRGPLVALALLAVAAVPGCGGHRTNRLSDEGRHVFVAAGCGSCHTVTSVHAHGRLGPDFDKSEQLSRRQIRTQLDQGEGGMPSFRDRLTARQKRAVTEFVYQTMRGRE